MPFSSSGSALASITVVQAEIRMSTSTGASPMHRSRAPLGTAPCTELVPSNASITPRRTRRTTIPQALHQLPGHRQNTKSYRNDAREGFYGVRLGNRGFGASPDQDHLPRHPPPKVEKLNPSQKKKEKAEELVGLDTDEGR